MEEPQTAVTPMLWLIWQVNIKRVKLDLLASMIDDVLWRDTIGLDIATRILQYTVGGHKLIRVSFI